MTKEQIAVSLGYKPHDSFGGSMWFKDGMNYLKLSDTPDSKLIEATYRDQLNPARYTIVYFLLAVIDFSIIKLLEPPFGVSLTLLALGGLCIVYALEAAKAWRRV